MANKKSNYYSPSIGYMKVPECWDASEYVKLRNSNLWRFHLYMKAYNHVWFTYYNKKDKNKKKHFGFKIRNHPVRRVHQAYMMNEKGQIGKGIDVYFHHKPYGNS